MSEESSYPPISDYALIADSNSAALVSRAGSVDWCCIQRLDAGSCFGRLLDWERGGFCSLSAPEGESSRRYLDRTLVLETTFRTAGGVAKLYDFRPPDQQRTVPVQAVDPHPGGCARSGATRPRDSPRFDYGSLKPWIRQEGVRLYSAIGGNDGLLISSNAEIKPNDD